MKALRVAMIVNKPEREDLILERIAQALRRINPACVTERVEYRDPAFFERVTQFEPTVILTFPLTSRGIAARFYALKYALDCRIVSYRTEGQISLSDANYSDWMVGFDEYGANLVDWELFWGELSGRVVGQSLVDQGKLSDIGRARAVGYPRYESYFDAGERPGGTEAELRFLELARGRPRERVAFFISGFGMAEYSVEDLLRGGDVFRNRDPLPEEVRQAREAVEKCREFRRRWIDAALAVADLDPDLLVVFKSHPVENIIFARQGNNPYDRLRGRGNVLYIDTPVGIDLILRGSGLFFHYGSTVAAESYIAGTPCIFTSAFDLYPEDQVPENPCFYFHDLGWPASAKLDIADVPDFVRCHLENPVRFERTERMSWVLDKVFAIRDEHLDGRSRYSPSREIAAFLAASAATPMLDPARDAPFCDNALRSVRHTCILEAMFGRAQNALLEGRYADALRLVDRMEHLVAVQHGREPVLPVMRAQIFAAQKKFNTARALLRTELARCPDNTYARDYLDRLAQAAQASGGGA